MITKSKYRKILLLIIIFSVIFTSFYCINYFDSKIPDKIIVSDIDNIYFENVPLISYQKIDEENSEEADEGISIQTGKNSNSQRAVSGIASEKNANDNSKKKSVYYKARLFNYFDIKDVKVEIAEERKVNLGGFQVGIYLKTDGVLVVGCGEVSDLYGKVSCPVKNIVNSDDYIVAVNDEHVSSKSQLMYLVNKYGDRPIKLKIRRNGEELSVKVNAVQTSKNEYKLGIWVRDDTQGIGTVTYYENDGSFAALGHGINDIDTGELLKCEDGKLFKTNVWGIKKGLSGIPGGLLGSIDYSECNRIGYISQNTMNGIFGKIDDDKIEDYPKKFNADGNGNGKDNDNSFTGKETENTEVSVGYSHEVKPGEACIRLFLDNRMDFYKINIERIESYKSNKGKNFVIKITDERLIEKTNGIVQGMSGSPIIQNGKIIGAVTHVFVDEPVKGYGIFIENMLE